MRLFEVKTKVVHVRKSYSEIFFGSLKSQKKYFGNNFLTHGPTIFSGKRQGLF